MAREDTHMPARRLAVTPIASKSQAKHLHRQSFGHAMRHIVIMQA